MADPDFRLTAKQHEVNGVLGGTQTHTLVYGGGRSGKTFLITRAILIRAMRAPKSTHFILRHRFNAVVRSIGGENGTLPTVLRLCFPEIEYDVDLTQWIYTRPNGSQIYLMGLDDKNRTEKMPRLKVAGRKTYLPCRELRLANGLFWALAARRALRARVLVQLFKPVEGAGNSIADVA